MKMLVCVKEIWVVPIEVEAETIEEAKTKARDIYRDDSIAKPESEYSDQVEIKDWSVFTDEEDGGPFYNDKERIEG